MENNMKEIMIEVPEYVMLKETLVMWKHDEQYIVEEDYLPSIDNRLRNVYEGTIFIVCDYNHNTNEYILSDLKDENEFIIDRNYLIKISDDFINYIKEKN